MADEKPDAMEPTDVPTLDAHVRVVLNNPAIEEPDDPDDPDDEGTGAVLEFDLPLNVATMSENRDMLMIWAEDPDVGIGPFSMTLSRQQASMLAMDLVAVLTLGVHRRGNTLFKPQ